MHTSMIVALYLKRLVVVQLYCRCVHIVGEGRSGCHGWMDASCGCHACATLEGCRHSNLEVSAWQNQACLHQLGLKHISNPQQRSHVQGVCSYQHWYLCLTITIWKSHVSMCMWLFAEQLHVGHVMTCLHVLLRAVQIN